MKNIYEWPEVLNMDDFERMVLYRLPYYLYSVKIIFIDEDRSGLFLNVAFTFSSEKDGIPPYVFYTHFCLSELNDYIADRIGGVSPSLYYGEE